MNFKTDNYTAESVTSGHPDKLCDQISDAILDECLRQDPKSRVAIETFGSHGLLVIGGEITSDAQVDFANIARDLYQDIGYANSLTIITNVVKQSPDIAQGVDTGGAGDQGIMYGFASNETPELLPSILVKVHKLAGGLEKLRKENTKFSWLRPDGKTQITVENGKNVLIAAQHDEKIGQAEIKNLLTEYLMNLHGLTPVVSF